METDPTVITGKVKTRETEENELYARQDDDFDLWDLGTSPVPVGQKKERIKRDTDIDIVSNKPRTFADKVQAILSAAEMQIRVRMAEEGEDKRDDIGKLERLFYFALEKADERLGRLLLPPLREQLIWYGDIRGWRAARVLVYKLGKDVIFDIMPLDRKWLTYDVGSSGFLWVGYKSFRSASSLKDGYDYKAKNKNNNEVIDWWETDDKGIYNAVVCNNEFLKEPKKIKIPSMPFSVRPVATRPPISSTESKIKGYGESIFAPNREIIKLLNELASMWASHANLLAKQPTINYRDEQGIELKDTVYLAEAVLNLPAGHNRLEPSPLKEISPTLVNLLSWLDGQWEQGALPDISIGSPPPSGTLFSLVQEAGNRVYNPQVTNLNDIYADICHLVEEQLLAGKLKVEVETLVKDKYFASPVTPVDLKKPHIIKVEFTHRTPWTQLDAYQIADMAKRQGLPDGFIQEYILKLPDPKGLGDLSAIEMAEHSPKLAMVRAIQALLKAGRTEEAEQIMRDLYNLELSEQRQTEPTSVPVPTEMPLAPEMGGV